MQKVQTFGIELRRELNDPGDVAPGAGELSAKPATIGSSPINEPNDWLTGHPQVAGGEADAVILGGPW